MGNNLLFFTGSSNVDLAQRTAAKISSNKLLTSCASKFSDGETRVDISDHVRGAKVCIIQSTCPPVNDNLMELLLMADALKRSSARKITAVIPYFGYARQDRRPEFSRVPIAASVVAKMIEQSGISNVITVDLHATQIQGFFNVPVDNLTAIPLFAADIYRHWKDENPIIVSPDVGGVARARQLSKHVENTELAIVDKRRPKANVSEVMNIIGDVADKTCIIVDDMVDTAGTLCKAADALMDMGARRVVAYASHGILSGNAKSNLEKSALSELVITDTVPLQAQFVNNPKVRQITIADLLTEVIIRVNSKQSIGQIFN